MATYTVQLNARHERGLRHATAKHNALLAAQEPPQPPIAEDAYLGHVIRVATDGWAATDEREDSDDVGRRYGTLNDAQKAQVNALLDSLGARVVSSPGRVR